MISKKRLIWLALLGLAISILWWIRSGPQPQITIQGQTMGTYYMVKVVADPDKEIDAKALKSEIDQLLASVNKSMSTYDKSSELSLFNQSESLEPQPISSELAYVIDEAIRLGMMSDGALDVTVGPLVNLWGFGPTGRPDVVPTEKQVAQARKSVGLEHLRLSPQGLSKAVPKLYVDLSAIAKGYGVDQVASLLSGKGYANIMVDIGGELYLKGHNAEQQPWRIAIEKPVSGERTVQQVLAISNMGVATSGDYRNYFEVDGQRFSHTIDPETAKPIAHKLVSVTVLHDSTMTADGLATALMVMGDKRGLSWAENIDLPVYMVVKTEAGFEGRATQAMKPYLVELE